MQYKNTIFNSIFFNFRLLGDFMNISIKYNEELDEFTDDLNLVMRLENYVDRHFYPAYVISRLAPIYLVGGGVRDLIYAKKPKDLDFVVLGKEHLEWVLKVFKTYNIDYKFNKFGGYKFTYSDTEIDLWLTDDLYSSIEYNVDGLFFDLKNKSLISLAFDDFDKNGLKLINSENNIENGRKQKLLEFEKEYFGKYK